MLNPQQLRDRINADTDCINEFYQLGIDALWRQHGLPAVRELYHASVHLGLPVLTIAIDEWRTAHHLDPIS